MPEPLITVRRDGLEFIATAAGYAHQGTSQTSARCAAIHLMERVHGERHFLKFKIEQESAVFRLAPSTVKPFGGRRG